MPRHQTKRPEMMQLEMLAASFDAQVSVVGELWIPGLCPCQPALPTSGELPRKAYSAITGELLNLLLPWELPGPWSAWGEGGIGSFRAESSSSMLALQSSLSDTHLCLPAGVNECPTQRKEHSNLGCSRKEQPVEWNLPLLSNLCGGEWYELGENILLPQSISLHWEIALCMQSYISCTILHCSSQFLVSFHHIYEIENTMLWQLQYWHFMLFVRTGCFSSGSVLLAQPKPVNSLTKVFCCCLGWESTHDNPHSCTNSAWGH